MNLLRLSCLLLALALSTTVAAATRVLELRYAIPAEVAAAIRTLHGDAVRVDVIRQRLLIVADEPRLDEVAALVGELDQGPLPLQLSLTTRTPPSAGNGRHYQAGGSGVHAGGDSIQTGGNAAIQISSVEGALVTIEHSRLAQQAVSAGWTIHLAEAPVNVQAVTLQIRQRPDNLFDIVVGYADYSSGERRVLGNTIAAQAGSWTPLLPTPLAPELTNGTRYATADSDQLWLRVDIAR